MNQKATAKNLTPKAPSVATKPAAHSVEETGPASEKHPRAGVTTIPIDEAGVETLSDDELLKLAGLVGALAKKRTEAKRAKNPQPGVEVEVIDGKFKGKKGTIVAAGKTRAHVQVEGFVVQQYIAFEHLKAVAG